MHKGSLWSYVLGYAGVFLAVRSTPAWLHTALDRWARIDPVARLALGACAVVATAGFGLALRGLDPETFARFSREEGLWEVLSLTAFGVAAVALLRGSSALRNEDRRHLRLLGVAFVALALEEVDYFGVFGGLIGRVEGFYVGSPHDLVVLWREGLVPVWGSALLAGAAWSLVIVLLRRRYAQPARLLAMLASPAGLWLVVGLAFLGSALAGEAALLWIPFTPPSPEELVEVLGAICLLGFALEVRIAVTRAHDDEAESQGSLVPALDTPSVGAWRSVERPPGGALSPDALTGAWRGPGRRRRDREGGAPDPRRPDVGTRPPRSEFWGRPPFRP